MSAMGQAAAEGARPRSAVSPAVGLVGLAGLLAWTAAAFALGMAGPLAALCGLLACGVPMIVWSFAVDKVHRSPTSGIDWEAPPRPISETMPTSLVKIAGLWATWGAIGFLYCVGRWYWEGQYLFAMEVLGLGLAPLVLASIPYVIWLDRRLKEPRDGAWHFGCLVIGRHGLAERERIHEHLRCWAIKAFFLAFMLAVLPGNWFNVIRPGGAEIIANPVALTIWIANLTFMVDVSFATLGYMLTLKPLDAHIRSANPYAAGWTAALLCYPPFSAGGVGGPLNYHPGSADWAYWMEGWPALLALYAVPLIALHIIYAWATVAFGLRFSNLTHRGILTHGPYAWTKHPAYLSKTLFWWMASLPFLAANGNPVDMVRNTMLLAGVSGVYYWRARTEERHLLADPAYRDYAAWMAANGPLARLARHLRRPAREPELAAAE
jgi:protein-S-isoprenylcysteine O-methyltransferase Ste14